MGSVPAAAASATRSRSRPHTSRISFRYLSRGSPGPCVSWILTGRSPQSSTSYPSASTLACAPAARSADGPMSTPRRPAPRSGGSPIRVTRRFAMARSYRHCREHAHSPRRLSVDAPRSGSDNSRGERSMTSPQAKKTAAVTAPEAPELLSVLVTQKVLSADQAEKVRRAQKVNGFSAEQAMIQLGIVSDAQIAQALAAHAGLPYVKINPLDLDLDVVTKAIAGPFARRHGMVAIAKNGDRITIAVHNPFAPFPYEDVKRVTGCQVDRVVATRNDVEAVNKGFYDLKSSLKHAEKQLSESRIATVDLGNQEFLSKEKTDLDPAAAPVLKAPHPILGYAFEQRASDIHFEPKRELTLVRLRIDGVLHDVHVIPKIVYEAGGSRIKLLCGANLAEKRRPQDGRIKRDQGGREVELRVSTMPTAFGEKAVLRIFDPDILLKGIDELGLSAHDLP